MDTRSNAQTYRWNLDRLESSLPGEMALDFDTLRGYIHQGWLVPVGQGLFQAHATAETGQPAQYQAQYENGQVVLRAVAGNDGLKQVSAQHRNLEAGLRNGKAYGRYYGPNYQAELAQDGQGKLAGSLDVALPNNGNLNLRADRYGAGMGFGITRPFRGGELALSGGTGTGQGFGVGMTYKRDW